jgi:hypothetical protein
MLAAGLLVASCGAIGTPTPPPTAVPSSADFTLDVEPAMVVGRAIPGQQVVLLVSVGGTGSGEDVTIAADAPGASVSISPQPLPPGTVGEVTVVPEAVSAEEAIDVTIVASRAGIEHEVTRTITLAPGEDSLAPEAAALLRRFTDWLARERPDLAIGPNTTWEGTPGGWVLVVNHYQYISEAWELGLEWHVMVPPDDWARIYLRRRWTETAPSSAFEIPSISGEAPPHEMEPPESVWR